MKKTIISMMLICVCAVSAMADNVRFKVSNMHCDNCAKRVEKALKANEAVSSVAVDLKNHTVCVSYDATKTNAETLRLALGEAKFQAEIDKQCDKKEGCSQKAEAGSQSADAHKCHKEGGEKKECCEEK